MKIFIAPRQLSVCWKTLFFIFLTVFSGFSSGICSTPDGLNNQPSKAPAMGDPVSAGTGEMLMTLPLLYLPGPLPIDLKLYHMSQSNSPSDFGDRFYLNVPVLWRAGNDISVSFVNEMDEVEFQKTAEDDWEMIGHSSWPYELKAVGDHFFLKNPADNTVLYFEKNSDFLYLCRKKMDRAGNELTYTYNDFVGKGLPGLIAIENSSGMGIDISLEQQSETWVVTEIKTSSAPALAWNFSYTEGTNSLQLLSSMTNPEGNAATFAYDGDNRLTAMTTPRGTTPYTSEYDNVEMEGTEATVEVPVVVKQTDALSNITRFDYDFSTNTVTETRPDGERNIFITAGYQGRFGKTGGAAREVEQAGFGTLNFEQNGEGVITQARTDGGATFGLDYDHDSGRLSSFAVGADSMAMTYTRVSQTFNGLHGDSAEFTFSDETSRLYRPGNQSETLTYDASGNLLTFQDAGGNTWRYTRSSQGLPTRVQNPLGAAENFSYNENQLLASHTSPVSGATTFDYDDYGRLITSTDELENTFRNEYDQMGRITKESDALGQETRLAYDDNGNLISVTNALGAKTEFSYDAMDRLVQAKAPTGEVVSNTWDNMGRMATSTDLAGIATRYEYTTGGLVSRKTRADYEWSGTYNPDGLLSTDIESGGIEYAYSYDDSGRVTRIQDAENRIWQYSYDAFGNLLSSVNPAGQSTEYSHDPVGNLVKTVLPGKHRGCI